MDTEENRDSTRATLLEISEDRAARILENEKDISAVERVLAILDAKQRTRDEAELGAEEADEADKVEEGTEATDEPEATDEAEVTGPKPCNKLIIQGISYNKWFTTITCVCPSGPPCMVCTA